MGRGLFSIERMKLAVYVFVPVLTVVAYNVPAVYEYSLKTNRYVVYRYERDPPLLSAKKPPASPSSSASASAARGAAGAPA